MELSPILYQFFLGFLSDLFVNHYSLYIDDLLDTIQDTLSYMNLYADDVLLYQIVTCAADFLFL